MCIYMYAYFHIHTYLYIYTYIHIYIRTCIAFSRTNETRNSRRNIWMCVLLPFVTLNESRTVRRCLRTYIQNVSSNVSRFVTRWVSCVEVSHTSITRTNETRNSRRNKTPNTWLLHPLSSASQCARLYIKILYIHSNVYIYIRIPSPKPHPLQPKP